MIKSQQHDSVSTQMFQSKYKSKREVYNFLSCQVRAYLCDPDQLTIYFLKDIVTGNKKCNFPPWSVQASYSIVVPCEKVSYIFVPHYSGLSIQKIIEKASQFTEAMRYLPDHEDQARISRQWCCNVINTVVGQLFADWVEARCNERNEKLAIKNDFLIAMDPAIA